MNLLSNQLDARVNVFDFVQLGMGNDSLGPTPKNRPGTHCLRMRVINTLNVGIPTFRYTFRVRPLRVTSRRITLRCVSVHYACAMACLQPSGFDLTLELRQMPRA